MAKKNKFLKWFPNAVCASVVTTFVHNWVWCRSSVSQQTAALLFSRSTSLLCLPPSTTTRESLLVIYELVCGLDYENGVGGKGEGRFEADGTGTPGTGRGAGPQLVFD